MLGRKQSVRNNEDWKNALDHIEETVSKKELDSLVKKTVKDIKEKCNCYTGSRELTQSCSRIWTLQVWKKIS